MSDVTESDRPASGDGNTSDPWIERYARRIEEVSHPIRGRLITQAQAEVLLEKVDELRANIVVAARL